MIRALLLDFYGTLVHEDDAFVAGISEQIASRAASGVSPSDVAKRWADAFAQECLAAHGDGFKNQRALTLASLGTVLEQCAVREDAEQLTASQFEYWRQPQLFDDTEEFLARVEIPICIVSNIDRADLEAALDYHGLAFDQVVTSEDVRSYKPRAEPFRRAIDRLGIPMDAVIHVGDSLSSDVAGASAVGVPVAWLNRAGQQRPSDSALWAEVADLVTLSELIERRT